MDKDGWFNFQSYAYSSRGIHKALLFDEKGREKILVPHEVILLKAQTLLVIIASTLLAIKLETWESVSMYNFWRVFMQLGYDQGAMMTSGELPTSSILVAKARFFGEGPPDPRGDGKDVLSGSGVRWSQII